MDPFDNFSRVVITPHVSVDLVNIDGRGWFAAANIESNTPPKHLSLHDVFFPHGHEGQPTDQAAIDASLAQVGSYTCPDLMPYLLDAQRVRCLPIPGEPQQLALF